MFLVIFGCSTLLNTVVELVEGESPQEFESVCHSHKSLDSTIRGNNMIIPKG